MRKVSQLGTMNPTLLVLRWFLVTLLNKWRRKYWTRSSSEHVVQLHYTNIKYREYQIHCKGINIYL